MYILGTNFKSIFSHTTVEIKSCFIKNIFAPIYIYVVDNKKNKKSNYVGNLYQKLRVSSKYDPLIKNSLKNELVSQRGFMPITRNVQ